MNLPIPDSVLAQHVIALGKTGAGKSSKLRVLVERLLDLDKPVCIIDPKGDWWGLKSSADGKRAGFPIVIFGGEHADVPINAHSGCHVAELVATGNRPALIDLRGWMPSDRTDFFIDFAGAVFKHTRGSRYLVIDEVHNFAPKGKVLSVEAGRMLHWANRLASEGRGLGLTILAASQRPQKVHNDFLTSCETLIAAKVIHKADRDAIKDWIDGCAEPELGKQVIGELAQLKKPEAWVWSPEIEFGPERVTFPLFRTYDSFKPQDPDTGKLKGWADVDLEDVKAKLANVVAEAEANDPKKLKAQIADLQREVRTLVASASRESLHASTDALAANDAIVAELRDRIATLERDNRALEQHRDELVTYSDNLRDTAASARNTLVEIRDLAEERLGKWMPIQPLPIMKPSAPAPAARSQTRLALPSRPAATPAPRPGKATGVSTLRAGAHRCMTAVAQYAARGGVDKSQLKALTGYASRSVETHVSELRVAGFVGEGWPLFPTDAGLKALGSYEALPMGDELRDYWMRELSEGPRRILSLLADAHPHGLGKAELIEHSGYASRSVETHVSALKVRCLVNKTGGRFHASEQLFG